MLLNNLYGKIKYRRFYIALVSTAIVFAAFISYFLFRPLSPDAICQRTITALELQDAATLVSLADPDELKQLNLSKATVHGFLSSIMWDKGFSGSHKYRLFGQKHPDAITFEITTSSLPADTKLTPLYVSVVDDPHIGWKLNLSMLLYMACYQRDMDNSRKNWVDLRTKYDIRGLRQYNGTYRLLNQP